MRDAWVGPGACPCRRVRWNRHFLPLTAAGRSHPFSHAASSAGAGGRKGSIAEGLLNSVGFGTTQLHVIRPGPEMDRQYLFYLTLSGPFRKLGAAEMYGAGGQKRVPDDFIHNFRAPLPLLPEQPAIAAFLDRETQRIDALVAKKRRLIDLLQEKRAALISHAVTKGLNPAPR